MTLRPATDRLRLVRADGGASLSVLPMAPAAPRRRRAVVNPEPVTRNTSVLAPTDARWVLASRVQESLEGGRAGVLGPESRSRLIDLGRRLGLRPFDINLIIAIVQDHARCGGSEPRAEMLHRLALVPGTHRHAEACTPNDGRAWWAAWIGATVILAAVLALAGIAWLQA